MPGPPLFTLPALRRAHDLIDLRFAEPLDLDALAREAGYSKYYFARAFAAAYGETPRGYLTRRRLERAKTLLRTTNLTVTEVCFAVGFASLGSFSSLFRRIVRETPSAYQRAAAQRDGPPPIPGCIVLMWTRPTGPTPQAQRSLPRAKAAIVDGRSSTEDDHDQAPVARQRLRARSGTGQALLHRSPRVRGPQRRRP